MNTTYWIREAIGRIFSSGSYYVGLSSTAPNPDGTGVTEPMRREYSRVPIPSFSPVDTASMSNTDALIFPGALNPWFTEAKPATHWVVFDGLDDDAHLLASGMFKEPVVVPADVVPQIEAGSIVMTLTDAG